MIALLIFLNQLPIKLDSDTAKVYWNCIWLWTLKYLSQLPAPTNVKDIFNWSPGSVLAHQSLFLQGASNSVSLLFVPLLFPVWYPGTWPLPALTINQIFSCTDSFHLNLLMAANRLVTKAFHPFMLAITSPNLCFWFSVWFAKIRAYCLGLHMNPIIMAATSHTTWGKLNLKAATCFWKKNKDISNDAFWTASRCNTWKEHCRDGMPSN